MKSQRFSIPIIRRGIFVIGVFFAFEALVSAREAEVSIDLAEGSASETLREFVLQTNLQVLFDSEAVSGFATLPVAGRYRHIEAISRMLEGSILSHSMRPPLVCKLLFVMNHLRNASRTQALL